MGSYRRTTDSLFKSFNQQFSLSKATLIHLLCWLAVCAGMIATTWLVLHTNLKHAKEHLREDAFKTATSLAASYAKQITQAVTYLDERTRSLAFQWNAAGGVLRLESRADAGIYTNETSLVIGITDENGNVITSLPAEAKIIKIGESPVFKLHKEGKALGLQMRRLEQGQFTNGSLIAFSRSLKPAPQAFEGVVFTAVAPNFLASHYDQPLQGKDDVVAVLTKEGNLLASIMGENIRSHKTIAKHPGKFDSPRGITVATGERYIDGLSRVVAWQEVKGYPMVAVVALAEKGIYAELEHLWKEHRKIGIGLNLLAVFVAAAGFFFSTRLAYRRQQVALVKNTYRLATNNTREAFFMIRTDCDNDGTVRDFIIEDCNERGAEFLRLPLAQALGSSVLRVFKGDAQAMLNLYQNVVGKGFYEDEFQTVSLPGGYSPNLPFEISPV